MIRGAFLWEKHTWLVFKMTLWHSPDIVLVKIKHIWLSNSCGADEQEINTYTRNDVLNTRLTFYRFLWSFLCKCSCLCEAFVNALSHYNVIRMRFIWQVVNDLSVVCYLNWMRYEWNNVDMSQTQLYYKLFTKNTLENVWPSNQSLSRNTPHRL